MMNGRIHLQRLAAIALLAGLGAMPLAAQSAVPVHLAGGTGYRLDAEPIEVPVERASRISLAAREAHDAAIEYAEAILVGNWRRAARAMHPDALAEIKAAVRRKAKGDPTRWPLSLMPGTRTIEAFDAMPAELVYVRVMRLIDAARPEETAGLGGIEFRELEVESDSEVVVEADLLNRDEHGEVDRSHATIRLRRLGEEWKAMPERDLRRIRKFHP